jgi:hypothetical protein
VVVRSKARILIAIAGPEARECLPDPGQRLALVRGLIRDRHQLDHALGRKCSVFR